MDDRYEILDELGKGGLGAVFKGYDRNLKREVAIKRILPGANEADREAGLKQLTEEAENLCALQHPHIVTVYDVGSDEEGPFVVMELLTGNTLEELVENGPLTWEDFRELALQTQEALIAAQEHHLVHRDIKPGNVMLTWLPSGKFQAKLVDFGLAKFSPRPTMQEIGEDDSVFGSIFFMAPEQFERKPLDARTDMYAMGCVYYHSLVGAYPFDGKTGQEVMQAHLQHTLKPLHEMRADIPRWASDWVMWHMNRDPGDRPPNAREALQQFIVNEQAPTQSQAAAQRAPDPLESKRRKLLIPGTTPEATPAAPAATPATPATPAAPTGQAQPAQALPVEAQPAQPAKPVQAQPANPAPAPAVPAQPASPPPPPAQPAQPAQPASPPPPPAKPAKPVQAQPVEPTPAEAQPAAASPGETARPEPKPTSPQPLQPPAGSAPSVHDAVRKATSQVGAQSAEIPTVALKAAQAAPGTALLADSPDAATAQALPADHIGDAVVGEAHDAHKKKKRLNPAVTAAIATVLGLLAVLLGYLLLERMGKNRRIEIYNALVAQAKVEGVTEIPVDKKQLEILLEAVGGLRNTERETIYQTLYLSKSTDGTDIDQEIAKEATKPVMNSDIRNKLFKVLELRANPAVIPALLDYARTSDKVGEVGAALEACKNMATDDHFGEFLKVLEGTEDVNIRRAAETTISEIIERSKARQKLADQLVSAHQRQLNDTTKHALLRLLGYTGTDTAREMITGALDSDDKLEKQAAVLAIGTWPDDSMFEVLISFMSSTDDEQFRSRAFKTAYNYLRYKKSKRGTAEAGKLWKLLAGSAKTEGEKKGVINSMPQLEGDWRIPLLKTFLNDESDRVIDDAERVIDYLGGDAEEEEEPKKDAAKKKAAPKKK